ncbi:putative Photosystem I reaction center subunit psaK, chloroplastic [Nannochloris sp. 'desiccata']|nr:putative Photosystem I reaction center subunit psaK, chloroplastic [Chlorella desiccata (nom. nud.)]
MKNKIAGITAILFFISQVTPARSPRSLVVPRADGFLGSSVNQIMIVSTTLTLVAGRFGLAPTANRNASAGLKLSDNKAAGLYSNDPAGFTMVDVMALGAMGHVLGVGIVLGLKGTGNL